MRPADEIQNVVKKMSFKAGPEMDKDLWAETAKARNESRKTMLAPGQHNIGRTIMKSPIARLSAAAAVIIACLIALSLWRGTESGIALADVLAAIEKVQAFRYQSSEDTTVEGLNELKSGKIRSTHLESQEYGEKIHQESLDPNGTKSTFELYRLPDKRTIINISHQLKKYWRYEFDANAVEVWSNYDPSTLIKRILEFKHENLGRSTIDGIEVEGFQTTDPNYLGRGIKDAQCDVKLWVDVKTLLPVRYEVLTSADFVQKGNKIISRCHNVFHDFQWDVPIDASEFKPVIPDDYIGVVVRYPEHITEETVIQGLKLIAELLGNYPRKITNVPLILQLAKKSGTPAALRLQEETKGLTEEEALNKLVDFLIPIRGLQRFTFRVESDRKDLAYYGNTVTPKDADKVLMRWKLSDNEYRVIFGDLHTETVTPEKLAELEAGLPK